MSLTTHDQVILVNPVQEVVTPTSTPIAVVKKAPIVEEVVHKTKIVTKAPITKGGDCSGYIDLINKYPWPTTTAMTICSKESKGNAEAINWTDVHKDRNGNVICISSRGLMQVGCAWPRSLGYTLEDTIIPEKNMAMAYKIYVIAGHSFSPWTTYKQ